MLRCRCLSVMLFTAVAAALLAADDKVRTPKQIMNSAHSAKGLLKQVEKGAKAGEPDWTSIKKAATEYARETAELKKNKSPKAGQDKLWEELTTKLADSGKAVEEAAKKEDATELTKATTAIRPEQCARCHKMFRGD